MRTTSRTPSGRVAFALLAAALAGCGSAPAVELFDLPPGARVEIAFEQEDGALRQSLVSPALAEELQLDRRATTNEQFQKVLELDGIAELLGHFEQRGFFDSARGQALPGWNRLVVAIDGRTLWWTSGQHSSTEELERLRYCQNIFFNTFNAVTTYRASVGDNTVLQKHYEQQRERERRLRESSGRR